MSSTVLSTKILTPSQKELLLNAGLGLVEYNAIAVEYLDFKIEEGYDHYIFTSQNGVKSFLRQRGRVDTTNRTAFCVGTKTERVLKEIGINVVEMAKNSSELAQMIIKTYKNGSFLFFSGNLRRDDIPAALTAHDIRFKEIVSYRTILGPKAFEGTFDGVLFFSPSGVKSHVQQNEIKESVAFCIGETTADAAKKYTEHIKIANKQTIENVIVQAVNYFKN